MGLNSYLLELAKANIKRGFDTQVPLPAGQLPARGLRMGPAALVGRGIDAAGRVVFRHPLLSLGLPLAAYGAHRLYGDLARPASPDHAPDEVKQADVPPTPMSQPTGGMPSPGTPPPTNAVPISSSPPQSFGSVSAQPSQQVDQAQPMVTTSQGAANMPKQSVQGAQQRAVGLVKQPSQ